MMELPSMTPFARRWTRPVLAACLLLAFLLPASGSQAQSVSSPLANLAGSWSGEGTITLASGERESIRCRGSYSVAGDGNSVKQDLRCASDSYKFDVDSEFSYNADAGTISGTWQEKSYKNGGVLSGTARAGSIEATVDGNNFKTRVVVGTNGSEQSVSIRPEGTDVSEVTVRMRRSG